MTDLPRDVRHTVFALFGIALLCVVMAGVYTNLYLFVGPLGETLPDISPTAAGLALAFQITAALLVLWALGLATLATPASGAALHHAWVRASTHPAAPRRAVAAAFALALLYTAARFAFNIETIHAPLTALTDGTALLPFQYRALVPWMVRALTEALPHANVRALYAPFEVVAAVGAWAATAYLLRVLGIGSARLAALGVFVPLAFNLAAPWRYNNVYFPYDTPSVALFTLGLALLLDNRMRTFLVVFAVATLNRETTCFLTVAYVALALGHVRLPRIALVAGLQLAIWVGLKAGLASFYAANAPLDLQTGALFSGMVARSGRLLMSVPGLVYIGFVSMGGAGGVALLLRRRVTDVRLRRLVWIVPPFLFGMAIVGEMMEVRIYTELVPLVVAALVVSFRSVVREAALQHAASSTLIPA